MENETYQAKITDADGNEGLHPVKIPEVHILKKGKTQCFLGNKGGYFFMVKAEAQGMGDTGSAALAAMAIGFYYACGPDSEDKTKAKAAGKKVKTRNEKEEEGDNEDDGWVFFFFFFFLHRTYPKRLTTHTNIIIITFLRFSYPPFNFFFF